MKSGVSVLEAEAGLELSSPLLGAQDTVQTQCVPLQRSTEVPGVDDV